MKNLNNVDLFEVSGGDNNISNYGIDGNLNSIELVSFSDASLGFQDGKAYAPLPNPGLVVKGDLWGIDFRFHIGTQGIAAKIG